MLTFEGYVYDDPATCRSPAYMSIRGPTINRFTVQRYPTVDTTNDIIKEILAAHGVRITGRKDQLINKLTTLATERYNALEPILDKHFTAQHYLKTPQGKSRKAAAFPVLEDNQLNQLVLGMYIARHLRGNVILEAGNQTTAVSATDTARALIQKKITLECDFIAVEHNQPTEVKP